MQVSDQPVRIQSVSPDGRFVAGTYWDPVALRFTIAVLALRTSGPPTVLPIVPAPLAWTPTGHALGYLDRKDGVTQLFSRAPVSGAAAQLTKFTGQDLFDFAWSRNGRRLAFARGTMTTDVVLLSPQREGAVRPAPRPGGGARGVGPSPPSPPSLRRGPTAPRRLPTRK